MYVSIVMNVGVKMVDTGWEWNRRVKWMGDSRGEGERARRGEGESRSENKGIRDGFTGEQRAWGFYSFSGDSGFCRF